MVSREQAQARFPKVNHNNDIAHFKCEHHFWLRQSKSCVFCLLLQKERKKFLSLKVLD